MTLRQAQLFFINLYHRDILFHLDDDVVDCIGHILDERECADIQRRIDYILRQKRFDWGLFEDAYGFCIALHNGELDQWIASLNLIELAA